MCFAQRNVFSELTSLGAPCLKGQMWQGLGGRKRTSSSGKPEQGALRTTGKAWVVQPEDVVEPLAALPQWLCDAGQATNLPDPVPAPVKQE